MANYHLEVSTVSRGRGESVTNHASYISGRTLYDIEKHKTYRKNRHDVLDCRVYLPQDAPSGYGDLQTLCSEIDRAEHRYDARTARVFIASLPNELPQGELIGIVEQFVQDNFTSQGLAAIAAIHQGLSQDPVRNNPHAHILVTTRTLGPQGFSPKKDREHDKRFYIEIWRCSLANLQNQAYERNHMDTRVSHESLYVQGVNDREPTIHLSHIDYQREQRGIRTEAGDRKREIERENVRRQQEKEQRRERIQSRDRDR